jgi:hypothetical protein
LLNFDEQLMEYLSLVGQLARSPDFDGRSVQHSLGRAITFIKTQNDEDTLNLIREEIEEMREMVEDLW